MTMQIDTSTFSRNRGISPERARNRLLEIIEAGKARAMDTYEHAMTAVIDDSLVRDTAMKFGNDDAGRVLISGRPLTDHALAQVCTRYGMPTSFARDMMENPSQLVRAACVDTLETLATVDDKGKSRRGRALVRSQGGMVRAVLSDSYKRIDSRPMINTFVEACATQGLVPVDGHVTDTRISIKAVLPRLMEPVAGEFMTYGMSLKTSDYGNGAFTCTLFALRLICNNGMTLDQVMKQVHLGRKLDENTFSQRTYDLDAATSTSALNDVVKASLLPESIDSITDMLRRSMEGGENYSAKDRLASLQKGSKLTKGEAKAIGEIYVEPDVEKLPPGNSDFRLANAISWFAHSGAHSADRRLDLEKLAGDLIAKPT